jgi:hypothetical protein
MPLLAARALNVHVSVRTMMSPNKNSEILSTGSKTRLVSLVKFAGISMVVRYSQKKITVSNAALAVTFET